MSSATAPIGAESRTEPSQLEVSSVPDEFVDYVWASQIKQIERALRHGVGDGATSEGIYHGIRQGRNIRWAVHKGDEVIAVIVLSVKVTSRKTKLILELIAGRDMDEWADKAQTLLADFRDIIGADCIEAWCRFGLVRKLERLGWSQKAVIMEL